MSVCPNSGLSHSVHFRYVQLISWFILTHSSIMRVSHFLGTQQVLKCTVVVVNQILYFYFEINDYLVPPIQEFEILFCLYVSQLQPRVEVITFFPYILLKQETYIQTTNPTVFIVDRAQESIVLTPRHCRCNQATWTKEAISILNREQQDNNKKRNSGIFRQQVVNNTYSIKNKHAPVKNQIWPISPFWVSCLLGSYLCENDVELSFIHLFTSQQ